MTLVWHQDDWLDALEQPSRLDRMKFAFVILAANLWDFMETRTGKLLAQVILVAAVCFFWYELGKAVITHWDWLRSL